MTTERQLRANRQNALSSTGPRTPAGKAASSRNNTSHGLYSSAPVIPRLESQTAWEHHRATTVSGLYPANAIEEALAERVALILWRLGRVTRYEQTVTTQGQDDAPNDLTAQCEYTDDDVHQIRASYALARRYLRAFVRLRQLRPDAPMTGADANTIIGTISSQIEGFDLAPFSVPGIAGADDHIPGVPGWTVARIQQYIAAIAEATSRNPADLIALGAASTRHHYNQAHVAYRQLTRQLHALRRERILPQAAGLANVIRYENHLTRQLNQTLTQLRQLQQHRAINRPYIPYNDSHTPADADRLPSRSTAADISEHSNPIPPGPAQDSTPEFTPWPPQTHA